MRWRRIAAFAGWVGVVVLSVAAPPHARAADVSSDLSRARRAVGLSPVPASAAVAAAATALAKGQEPGAAFASAGGSGELQAAIAPAGSALSTGQLKRVVFDPRVNALAGVRVGGKVAVAATIDRSLPFTQPVLAGAVADPAIAGSIALIFPPSTKTIPKVVLTEQRGGGVTVTIGIVATATEGLAGAILVQLKGRDRVTGPQIGYGLHYRLGVGGSMFTLKTRPLPPVLANASFATGDGFTSADRARLMSEIRVFPAEARKIVDYIGGAITVRALSNTAPVCGGQQTSCAGYDAGNGYFMLLNRAQMRTPFGRFAIAHELGHLVDFLGLDTFADDRFYTLFKRSRQWRSCFRFPGGCTPLVETFADQTGVYELGLAKQPSGYNDPVLAPRASIGKLLQQQWAFRPPQERNPLAGFGPLAKTFTDALGSGGSGL
jgi:hypothetical protein